MLFKDRNNTNFPKSLVEHMRKITAADDEPLRLHQKIPMDYMLHGPSRGMLLLHEMGTGKSITAAAITEEFIKKEQRKIIFISSRSLHENFRKSIRKYYDLMEETMEEHHIEKNYGFVTFDASNMLTQIQRVTPDNELNLDNMVVVIDEAHNFFNSVTNGSEKATTLYDVLINAKNIKILFLTGAGMINHPFEIAICYNILAGILEQKYQLFGDDFSIFANYFIKHPTAAEVDGGTAQQPTIRNSDKFKNRIYGLTSFYKRSDALNQYFPKQYPMDVREIVMSEKQFIAYINVRETELEEASRFATRIETKKFQKPKGASSTYRIKSRQISNILFPSSKVYRKAGKVVYEVVPFNGKYTVEILEDYSPKLLDLIKTVSAHLPAEYLSHFKTKRFEIGPGLIYSQFLDSGVECMARILTDFGMKRIDSIEDLTKILRDGHKGTYVVFSGKTDLEEREKLLRVFNQPENRDGSMITLLLYTKTGAEGMDTKNVRHNHIMEPYWNWNRIDQIKARSARYMSHMDLPKADQTVRTYLYLSTVREHKVKHEDPTLMKEESTDVTMYKKALQNKVLINSFLDSIEQASIDCMLHSKHPEHCTLCMPTDRVLFIPNLNADMRVESRCQPLKEEKIVAQKITVECDSGECEFMYVTKPDLHIFEFNKELNGYVEIFKNHSLYEKLEKAISRASRS